MAILEVGLKATRNTIGAPFVIPPFTPPAPFFFGNTTSKLASGSDSPDSSLRSAPPLASQSEAPVPPLNVPRVAVVSPSGLANPAIPGERTAVRRIFLTGPNADSQTILGDWAAPQPDSLVITVLDGLKAEFPGTTIDTMCFGGMISNVDAKGIAVARHKASAADVCIVVAGENSQRYSAFGRTCGENCDRDDLDLPGMQEELLEAIASTGKPTILVLMTGRANSIVRHCQGH